MPLLARVDVHSSMASAAHDDPEPLICANWPSGLTLPVILAGAIPAPWATPAPSEPAAQMMEIAAPVSKARRIRVIAHDVRGMSFTPSCWTLAQDSSQSLQRRARPRRGRADAGAKHGGESGEDQHRGQRVAGHPRGGRG